MQIIPEKFTDENELKKALTNKLPNIINEAKEKSVKQIFISTDPGTNLSKLGFTKVSYLMKMDLDTIQLERKEKYKSEQIEKAEEIMHLMRKQFKVHADFDSNFYNPNIDSALKRLMKQLKEGLQNGNHFLKGIIVNNELIGFAYFLTEEKSGNLEDLYVLEQHRGKGIGSLLIRETARFLQEKDKEILSLFCRNDEGTLSFYERLGFGKQSAQWYSDVLNS